MTIFTYTATFQQRNLFMHHAAHPNDPSFDLGFVYRLEGAVDVDRLMRATHAALTASPGLATRFVSQAGAVRAVVGLADLDVEMELISEGEDDLDTRIAAEAAAELARGPIDPGDPHQIRVRFYRSGDRLWMRLIAAHIVSDAYCFYHVMGAITALYRSPSDTWPSLLAPLAEHPGTTAPTPVPARWLESYDQLLTPLETFTHSTLAVPRTGGRVTGRRERVRYQDAAADRIRHSRPSAEFGSATVFFAAYAAALQRLAGTETVVLGIPLANRTGHRTKAAIGFYVNTLPLPVTITAGQTWWELCDQIKTGIRLLQANQGVDLSGTNASLLHGRSYPGLDNAVTFYKQGLVLEVEGAKVTPVPLERDVLTYPFVMTAADEQSDFLIEVGAADHLLPASPIALVVEALEAIISLPEAPVVTGSVFAEAPTHLAGAIPTPLHDTVVSRILAVAQASPSRVAMRSPDGDISYGTLAERINRVGVALDEAGAGEAVVVALPTSVDAVTVLLGVMASGRIHVPVDPSAPAARARLIIDRIADAHGTSPTVVTQDGTELVEGTVPLSGTALLRQRGTGRVALARRPSAQDPAYIIFTSGSTGEPKGVVIPHSNIIDLLDATDSFDLGPDDVWCLFHSLAFDFSVWEVFGALTTGGTLVVPTHQEITNPDAFAMLLEQQCVTVLNQTPSAFRRLSVLLTKTPRLLPAVRLVVFGGEALYPVDLQPWITSQGRRARLVNMYGITETTVHVTAHNLTERDIMLDHRSLIGRPLRHLGALVVDSFGRPTPDGVTGELLVTGSGLAHEYLGRPDLTATRFCWVLGEHGVERAYTTGDRVIRLPGGELVFVGRVDDQVQLRGYRIELGEIEAAFAANPDVSAVVVRLLEAVDAEPLLVAWVVTRSGAEPTIVDLRSAVAERVPSYMVPAAIIVLPVIPTTHNGKPDLAALPSPRTATGHEVVRPAGDLAQEIATVWEDTIGAGAVGIHDRFMDVGGTSMHVVAVHERLRTDLGLTGLSLVEIFEHATPAALAEHLAPTTGLATANADRII